MMSSSTESHLFGLYKPKRSPCDLKRIYLITLSELCVTISHSCFPCGSTELWKELCLGLRLVAYYENIWLFP